VILKTDRPPTDQPACRQPASLQYPSRRKHVSVCATVIAVCALTAPASVVLIAVTRSLRPLISIRRGLLLTTVSCITSAFTVAVHPATWRAFQLEGGDLPPPPHSPPPPCSSPAGAGSPFEHFRPCLEQASQQPEFAVAGGLGLEGR